MSGGTYASRDRAQWFRHLADAYTALMDAADEEYHGRDGPDLNVALLELEQLRRRRLALKRKDLWERRP